MSRTGLQTLRLGVAVWALQLAGTAHAVIGAADHVPAATLLLPYFEVSPTANLADRLPQGIFEGLNTIAQIRNASVQPVLARVTLWTDYGIPTLGFDVYLNGRDSQDLDLRLLFAGVLPVTGTGISQSNNVSGVNPPPFPDCGAVLNSSRLDATARLQLRQAHTGQPSAQFGGQCAGRDHGDSLARGYLTVDVVNRCSAPMASPADANYFVAGGAGVASNQNVLFGDYSVTDSSNNSAWGDRLLALEADAAHPLTSSANFYTFYAGFVGYSARDNRESLASRLAGRHQTGTGAALRADLIVWRDPRGPVTPTCGSVPAPWNQPTQEIVFFDEQSGAGRLESPRAPLGLATQRLRIDGDAALPTGSWRNFYTPFAFGWIYFNLNDATEQPGAPTGWRTRQGWVITSARRDGRFQSGTSALALDRSVESGSFQLGIGAPIYPQLPTTTTITGTTPSTSVTGQTVSVSFAVTPAAAAGTVRVLAPGHTPCTSTVAVGTCSLSLTPPAGTLELIANYEGQGQYMGSNSAPFTHTINKADSTLTITAHTPDPSVVNTPVTVSVAQGVVAPGTGTAALLAGTITVGDGVDSCTITTPAASSCSLVLSTSGSRTLTASWPGNTRYNGSTSAGVSHAVTVSRSAATSGGAP